MTVEMPAARNLRVRHLPHDRLLPEDPCEWTLAELEAWREVRATQRVGAGPHRDRGWENLMRYREEQLEGRVIYRSQRLPPAPVLREVPLRWLACRRHFADPVLPLVLDQLRIRLDRIPEEAAQAAAKKLAKRWIARHPRGGGIVSLVDGRLYPGGLAVRLLDGRVQVRVATLAQVSLPLTLTTLRALRGILVLWAVIVRRALAAHFRFALPLRPWPGATVQWALPLGAVSDAASRCQRAWAETTSTVQHLQILPTEPDVTPERVAAAVKVIRAGYTADRQIEHVLDHAIADLKPWWDTPLRPDAPTRADVIAQLDDQARQWIRPMRGGEPSPWGSATEFQIRQDSITGPFHWVTVPELGFAIDLERSNRPTVSMRLSLRGGA